MRDISVPFDISIVREREHGEEFRDFNLRTYKQAPANLGMC